MRIQSYTARSFSDLDVVYKESDVKELYEYHQNQITQLEQEVKELRAKIEKEVKRKAELLAQVIEFCWFYNPDKSSFELAKKQLAQHDKDTRRQFVDYSTSMPLLTGINSEMLNEVLERFEQLQEQKQ